MLKTTDLSKGNPLKTLILYALPMVISSCFQQFYNIADSVIAGRLVSTNALSAISASYPITMIFLAIGTGYGIGCTVVISKAFGHKDYGKVRSDISTALITICVAAVICTIIGIFITKPLLTLLNTPADIFDDAASYLLIYIYGLAFMFVYNACASSFQALGNSRTALYLLIFSSLLNIGLDVLFVTVFPLGVKGLAIATLIAQGVSCVMALILLMIQIKKLPKPESGNVKVYSLACLKNLAFYALPSITQQAIVSVGQLCVLGLVNSFGTEVIAGYGVAMKINTFYLSIVSAISGASTGYIAQNIGAGAFDNLKIGLKNCLILNLGLVVITCGVCIPLAEQIVGLFLNGNDTAYVLEVGCKFIYIVMPFYFCVAVKISSDSFLRGCGDMLSFMISTFLDLILRIIFAYWLVSLMDSYIGIWWSWPIGWVVGTGASVIFYLSKRWKRKLKTE